MPAASASGIRWIARSNQPLKPLTMIRQADTRNAPIASFMLRPDTDVISIAAPAVDHAVLIGMR